MVMMTIMIMMMMVMMTIMIMMMMVMMTIMMMMMMVMMTKTIMMITMFEFFVFLMTKRIPNVSVASSFLSSLR